MLESVLLKFAIALGMNVSVYSESFSSRKDDYPNINDLSLNDLFTSI